MVNRVCPDARDSLGAKSNALNFVKAKIDGNWVSLIGPDYVDDTAHKCEGPPISNLEDGESLLLGGGLEVELKAGPGLGAPDYDPDLAAIAVNLNNPPYSEGTYEGRDLSAYGGFYITYESDHTDAHEFMIELGWDEVTYNYDTWISFIPPTPTPGGVHTYEAVWPSDLKSSKGVGTQKVAGSFEQEGWSAGETPSKHGNAEGQTDYGNSIETAVKKMQAFKIRLKVMDGTTAPPPIKFKLIEFGFLTKGYIPVPVIKGAVQNVAKFSLNGRMLSMLSSDAKPVAVQVINLQGALVHSQTLASGAINLSHLPAGVYIVRAPGVGYSSRIMLK
jgi:hypothetical protein